MRSRCWVYGAELVCLSIFGVVLLNELGLDIRRGKLIVTKLHVEAGAAGRKRTEGRGEG